MKESFFTINSSFSFSRIISNFSVKDLPFALILSIILTGVIFFALPSKYTSKVTIIPSEDLTTISQNQGLSNTVGNLLGVSSSSGLNNLKFIHSMEVLNSYGFFEKLISKHDILLEINREANFYSKPSVQNAYRVLNENILTLDFDTRKNILILSATHSSGEFAKKLLDILVAEINETMKNEDVQKSQASINFLYQQIEDTELSEVKDVLSSLVQKQIEKIMIAESSPEYVFKTLDYAVIPEQDNKSKSVISLLLIQMLLLAISMLFFAFRRYLK